MGGAKKQTIGYKYFATFQMILARNIEKLTRITIGDTLAWSGQKTSDGTLISINKDELFGGKAREGGIVADINFQSGAPTQQADIYLEQAIGEPIPASRGVAGIVCRNGYLGNNPYMKDWKFRAMRIHTLDEGVPQWYDEKAEVSFVNDFTDQIGPSSSGWKYKVIALNASTDYSAENFDDSSWATGSSPFASATGHPYASAGGFPDEVGTVWPINTTMWVRKKFTIGTVEATTMVIFVDNWATVYVNGVLVLPRVGNQEQASVEAFEHEFEVPAEILRSGTNTIAMRMDDDNQSGGEVYTYGALETAGSNRELDMNPAHMLREALLNDEWGFGYDVSDIDDASFRAAADVFHAEGMGLSYFWDEESVELDDVVDKIQDHADCALYVDRSTQLWTIQPIRGGYDASALPVFEAGVDIISMDDFQRPGFMDLVNKVVVQFYDLTLATTGSVSVPNPALRLQQGVEILSQKNYEMCSSANLASRLGQRDLRTEGNPLAKGTVFLMPGPETNKLHRGSRCKLQFPLYGLNETIVCVTAIAFGDGKTKRIRMSFVEDKFALPDTAIVQPQPPAWVDPSGTPQALVNRLVIEAPYFYGISVQGQSAIDSSLAADPDQGYLGAFAARVQSSLNAGLYVDAGAGYTQGGIIDFGPFGTLGSDMSTTSNTFTLSSQIDLDELDFPTVFQIDDELLQIAAYDPSTNTASGVKRGVYDTVTQMHAVGARAFFFEDYLDSDEIQYEAGEVVDVKMLTATGSAKLDLGSAPVDTLTFDSRMVRPYPPGNLRVAGSLTTSAVMGAIALTWAHRNRIVQSDVALDYYSADVSPEAGTTYTVELWIDDALDTTVNGIATNFVSVSGSHEGSAQVRVYTVRDGYRSWQASTAAFAYTLPASSLTAGDGTTILTTPSGNYLRAS